MIFGHKPSCSTTYDKPNIRTLKDHGSLKIGGLIFNIVKYIFYFYSLKDALQHMSHAFAKHLSTYSQKDHLLAVCLMGTQLMFKFSRFNKG